MAHVTRYVGPTELLHKHGKVYLYDAGSGEIIAELTEEAAAAIRQRKPVTLDYDGDVKIGVLAP